MANVVNLYGSAAAIPIDELASMSKAQLVQCATILHSALTVANKHRFAAEREVKLMQAAAEGQEVSPEKKFICELEGKIHALENTLKESQHALMRVAGENGYLKRFVNGDNVASLLSEKSQNNNNKENSGESMTMSIDQSLKQIFSPPVSFHQHHTRRASTTGQQNDDLLPTILVDTPSRSEPRSNSNSINNAQQQHARTLSPSGSSTASTSSYGMGSGNISPTSVRVAASSSPSSATPAVVVPTVGELQTHPSISSGASTRSPSSIQNNNNSHDVTSSTSGGMSSHQLQQHQQQLSAQFEEERRKLYKDLQERENAQRDATKMLIRRAEEQAREQYEKKLSQFKSNATLGTNQTSVKISILEDELARAKGELLEQARAIRLREGTDVQYLKKMNETLSKQTEKDRNTILELKHQIALLNSKVREMESETEERVRDQMMKRLDELEEDDEDFLNSLLPDRDMLANLLSGGNSKKDNQQQQQDSSSLSKLFLMGGRRASTRRQQEEDLTNGGKIRTKSFVEAETQTESFMMRLVDVIKQKEDEMRSQKLENHSLTEQVLSLNRDMRDLKRENEELRHDAKKYSDLVNEMQNQLKLERSATASRSGTTLLQRGPSIVSSSSQSQSQSSGNGTSHTTNNNNNNNILSSLASANSFIMNNNNNNQSQINNNNSSFLGRNQSLARLGSIAAPSSSTILPNENTKSFHQNQNQRRSSTGFILNRNPSIISTTSEEIGGGITTPKNSQQQQQTMNVKVTPPKNLQQQQATTVAGSSSSSGDFGRREKSVGNFSASPSVNFVRD